MQTARRYFYQDGFTQNWFLLWSSWVISEEQHSIKTLEFTVQKKTLWKKAYFPVSSSYHQWVDLFENLLADRSAVDSTPKYFLRTWDTNQASNCSPCIRYKWVNSIDWST